MSALLLLLLVDAHISALGATLGVSWRLWVAPWRLCSPGVFVRLHLASRVIPLAFLVDFTAPAVLLPRWLLSSHLADYISYLDRLLAEKKRGGEKEYIHVKPPFTPEESHEVLEFLKSLSADYSHSNAVLKTRTVARVHVRTGELRIPATR